MDISDGLVSDMIKLISYVKNNVEKKQGIKLETEIEIVE